MACISVFYPTLMELFSRMCLQNILFHLLIDLTWHIIHASVLILNRLSQIGLQHNLLHVQFKTLTSKKLLNMGYFLLDILNCTTSHAKACVFEKCSRSTCTCKCQNLNLNIIYLNKNFLLYLLFKSQ